MSPHRGRERQEGNENVLGPARFLFIGRWVCLRHTRLPGFQDRASGMPTPPSDHTPPGGVVRLAGAIRHGRQIYNLGTQVDIRSSHWGVRSTHHRRYLINSSPRYLVPESVVLPPTAEHHLAGSSTGPNIATSDRTTSLPQVSRSHMRREPNLVRAHVSLCKKCWSRTR
jgi:hypothetical protein